MIYLLPVHPLTPAFKLGNDGSLYAFTDHYKIRPEYVPEKKRKNQQSVMKEFALLIKEIKGQYGMEVVVEMEFIKLELMANLKKPTCLAD